MNIAFSRHPFSQCTNIIDCVHLCIEHGHQDLATATLEKIKQRSRYGFQELHYQVKLRRSVFIHIHLSLSLGSQTQRRRIGSETCIRYREKNEGWLSSTISPLQPLFAEQVMVLDNTGSLCCDQSKCQVFETIISDCIGHEHG